MPCIANKKRILGINFRGRHQWNVIDATGSMPSNEFYYVIRHCKLCHKIENVTGKYYGKAAHYETDKNIQR